MGNIWAARAIEDLDFAYNLILQNHPGPVDEANPGFTGLMQRAARKAKQMPVVSRSDYQAALNVFAQSFRDHHLRFSFPGSSHRHRRPTPDWSIHRSDDLGWVRFSSFYPDNLRQRQKMQQVIAAARSLRGCRQIVFDVRGNGGGSSSWGEDLLAAVYGRGFTNFVAAKVFKNTYSQWRISSRTLAHFKRHREIYSPRTILTMARAIDQGLILTPPIKTAAFAHLPTGQPRPLSTARPIFLTDGVCFSATLDFLDIGKSLPRAVQVGQTTDADTVYMDVYSVPTPNGASFQFPWKVYRNRPRANNQPYVPDIIYRGNITDTVAVRRWLAQKVLPRL